MHSKGKLEDKFHLNTYFQHINHCSLQPIKLEIGKFQINLLKIVLEILFFRILFNFILKNQNFNWKIITIIIYIPTQLSHHHLFLLLLIIISVLRIIILIVFFSVERRIFFVFQSNYIFQNTYIWYSKIHRVKQELLYYRNISKKFGTIKGQRLGHDHLFYL